MLLSAGRSIAGGGGPDQGQGLHGALVDFGGGCRRQLEGHVDCLQGLLLPHPKPESLRIVPAPTFQTQLLLT